MRLRYCEISCDVNLSADCYENSGPERTMAATVREARKAGWHVGPSAAEQDACPTCCIAQQMEKRHGNPRPGSRNMEST